MRQFFVVLRYGQETPVYCDGTSFFHHMTMDSAIEEALRLGKKFPFSKFHVLGTIGQAKTSRRKTEFYGLENWLVYKHNFTQQKKGAHSMKTSADLVGVRRTASAGTVARSSLEMGDLFTIPGKVGRTMMHTGCRTIPPSEKKRGQDTFGTLPSGRLIIGFQSMIVEGNITRGEDGTVYTDNEKEVKPVGYAEIVLHKKRA